LPSVYVKTLGCKVNTYDSHALENQFRAQGYDLVDGALGADVTVVNTCSVTANAEREARYLARRIRRENPGAMVVFTGCYAQTDSAALAAMDEIDVVVPNEAKERLVGIVHDGLGRRTRGELAPAAAAAATKLPDGVKAVAGNKQGHFKSSATLFDKADSNQTRAFLKIQDGCDGFCSYCLIPYARGASRSVAPELVLAEVRRLVDAGSREIVLTGIHIGDYGRDLAGYAGDDNPIVTVLRQILAVPGLGRVRISSLEPAELSEPLCALMAEHRELVCDHLHLPLQSGSDRILKLMRRAYDAAGYAAAVERFRARFPEASIGADVIPGFPGETDADFADTKALIERLELSYLHVFPYSKRPNTAAARMPGHLDGDVVRARAAELRALSEGLASAYARRFIGRRLDVLWERDVDAQGRRLGYTANYLAVAAAGLPTPPAGALGPAEVKGFVDRGRLLARPLSTGFFEHAGRPGPVA
jgi:threonylcarbamoyladenosine tRNA methylthiotransferase MtaB